MRSAKIEEVLKQHQELIRKAWSRSKDFVLHGQKKEDKPHENHLSGLAEGNAYPFLHFVEHYGPRGLGLLLTDEDILKYVEQ